MGKETKGTLKDDLLAIADVVSKKSSLLCIHEHNRGEIELLFGEKDERISATIAAIMKLSFEGHGDEGMNRLTSVIMNAVENIAGDGSIASIRFVNALLDSSAKKLSDMLHEADCDDCALSEMCKNGNQERPKSKRRNNRCKKRQIKVD